MRSLSAGSELAMGSELFDLQNPPHGREAGSGLGSVGGWFVNFVVDYGTAVVRFALDRGDCFISALRSGASWALSLIS